MTDTPQLKPCPFCGSDNLKSGGDDKIVGTWCMNCQSQGPNHYVTGQDWNTRTPPKVKPLVWDTARSGDLFCLTTVADYTIREDEDGFPELEIKSCDAEEWESYEDVCEAYAAALADYTYRILEALE